MNHRPLYQCILAAFACSGLIIYSAILFHSTSLAYALSAFATPTPRSTLVTTATPTVIVISQPSSYTDSLTLIAIIGLVVQVVTLFFIIKYVRDTASMAKATRDSAKAAENTVQEMKEAREEEHAPFVVVYFDYIHSRYQSLYLVVENIGKSIARNIKFEFTPPLQVSQFNREQLEGNTLLKEGIKSLVPNYKIPIPFDYLMHYIRGQLPMEYMVKVIYQGNLSLPPVEFEYPLDLNHLNYIHFVTETGLGEIEQSLEQLANHFSHFSGSSDTTNYQLSQIANAINRGLVIKNRVSVSQHNEDIPAMLKEFVYLWLVDYGKQPDKWNKPYIFDLRAKAALKGEVFLNSAVKLDSQTWAEPLKRVISNLSKIGSTQVNLDSPTGTFSEVHLFLGGSSKEEFDALGDSIVSDIRTVIELIEKEQTAPGNDVNGEETQLLMSTDEAD